MGPDDDPGAVDQALKRGVPLRSPKALARYVQHGPEMVHQERLQNGRVKATAVTNFHARVAQDILLDDGEQQRREFGIVAELGGMNLAFSVPAVEFGRMGWVLSKLGPQAIIYPGQQQHARAAIQWLSGHIHQERIYTHLGWRKHGAEWVYLHGGGAISSHGPMAGLQVKLPAPLAAYQIGSGQDSDDCTQAVRASLQFLEVAPDRVTFPLLAGTYCAALGGAAFSLFLAGTTGVFKSALAALCQQHFGASLDANRLPANFASTANALESLAFHAKDALLVVDDFAPTGLQGDRGLQAIAERLFRAAGNHQGRSRMNNGGRPSLPQPPRGLVLATGEDVPSGQSLRARLLMIDVGPGDVDCATLTECQQAAEQGRLTVAMGSFLVWTAGQYDGLQQRFCERVRVIRSRGHGRAIHARLPTAVAQLQASFEIFLEFAFGIGAIGEGEQEDLVQRCALALNELIARQAKYHQASDPALRFLNLLRAALSCGQAHVSDRQGKVPQEPAAWGWKRKADGRAWLPRGASIGWLDGQNLYLEPSCSYEVAQQMAGNGRLAVSEQALRHRLRERHLLASVDVGRQMLLVRRTLAAHPRQVLHLKASHLLM